MPAVLVQIDGYDPVAGAPVTLRAASHDDDRLCHLNGIVWWPQLGQLPTLRYDLFDGAFGGKITTPQSELTLAFEDWPDLPRYMLADARIQLWVGELGDAWGSFVKRFDGRIMSQPAISNGVASISFAVDDRWLDTPLLALYAGTGGIEGEAAQKGQPKPLAVGAPRYVPGQMIDSINTVVQLSAYGSVQAVQYALERLARFGAAAGNFSSYAALVAASIPAGSWATCLASGLVRHGAPPEGVLSYQLQGDAAGPDGWVRLPGQVIKRIALLSGGAGHISDASLAALDLARPWPISIYVSQQTTARDLIQRIAASVNAVAGVDWLGNLFVVGVPTDFGTPSIVLDASGAALPPVLATEQLAIDAPFWRLAIGAQPTWQVHPLSDVAFTALLIERGLFDVAESYREGHIVDIANGARFLYVNGAPSVGHVPPPATYPPSAAAGDEYWKQISPPTTPLVQAESAAIYDAFTYANLIDFGQSWLDAGAAERSFVTTNDTGGRAIEYGNNSGDDGATLIGKRSLPFSPEDLYEISFDLESLAGSNQIYLGVIPYDSSGAAMSTDAGSYAYPAAAGHTLAAGARKTWKGYFRGTAVVGAGNAVGSPAFDPANPSPLPPNTVRVVPIAYLNYPNATGRVRVHEISLRKVADITVAPTGAWSSARSYFRNEGVTYQGRFFGSKADGNLNHVPPSTGISDSYWFLISDKGADGAAALTGYLTNESHTVPADNAGNVLSYTGASGSFKVLLGTVDVTAICTFARVLDSPPSLSYTPAGGIDASGNYAVTGGFTSAYPSGFVDFTATHTPSGQTITRRFSLSKSPTGAAGVSPPLISLAATSQIVKYDTNNAFVDGQTITFTAARQNTTNVTIWTLMNQAGVLQDTSANLAANYPPLFSTTGVDNLTCSAVLLEAWIATYGGFSVRTYINTTSIYDEVSVRKVRDGAAGADAKSMTVNSTHGVFRYDSNNQPYTQTTTVTATRTATSQPTTWRILYADGTTVWAEGNAAAMVATTWFTSTGGDNLSITEAKFTEVIGILGTTGLVFAPYFTDGTTYQDKVAVLKVRDGGYGASAFTQIGVNNMEVRTPGTITKSDGGAAADWNGKAYLTPASPTPRVSAKIPQDAMLGIDDSPSAGVSYTDIAYAIYRNGTDDCYLFVNGAAVLNMGAGFLTSSDTTTVYTDRRFFYMLKNGVEVPALRYPFTLTAPLLYPTFAASSNGRAFTNITYGSAAVDMVAGVTFVPSARLSLIGTTALKISGGSGWDASVRSVEGYAGDVQASARITSTAAIQMMGLNSDPASSDDFASLDFAVYNSTGTFITYESGTPSGTWGTLAVGDHIYVRRRGTTVEFGVLGEAVPRYIREGVSATTKLYFDSSFYNQDYGLEALSFLQIGTSGFWRDVRFKRSLAQPATPTGADPAGWTEGDPGGTGALWSSTARKTYTNDLIGGWSTPQSLSGLVTRGAYTSVGVYYINNVVTYNGGSYVAVQDNFSGQAPTGTAQANAYWDVYAAPGAPGTPATPPSGFTATINLTAGSAVNLRTVADANGYPGGNATITFNVPNGVVIRGVGGAESGNGGIGIDTGTWPSGYTIALTLVVQSGGVVDGGGGGGGGGGGAYGGAGGDAIVVRVGLSGGITINSGGTVRGGGGGGGSGANSATGKLGGGGGGGGAPFGAGGAGYEGTQSTGGSGSSGTASAGGNGGTPGGAAGGAFGAAGSNGTNTGAGQGGPAGYAVRKNGFAVTVTNNGTMTGTAA